MSNQKSDKGYTIEEIFKIIDNMPNNMTCFEKLGRLAERHKKKYQEAFEYFEDINSRNMLNGHNKDDDNRIKGKSLEDLVDILFAATGGYYEIYRNVRNGTNEVDLFLRLSDKGQRFSQILNQKYNNLLCECKNYKSTIDVTYVGKFCSLMQTTNNKIGIMFSYHGFTGKSWGAAKGLTKKIYLLRERSEDKQYILEFKKKDFKDILEGKSIFEILDDKCMELQMGIDDITKYITEHPNENKIP